MVSNLKISDAIFIFSVGGGNKEKKISENLIYAIDYAKHKKAKIFSFVGKKDGYAHKKSDISVLIPIIDPNDYSFFRIFSDSFVAFIGFSS